MLGRAETLPRDPLLLGRATEPGAQGAIKPTPMTPPIAIRLTGVIRLFSNEYFDQEDDPEKSASPPSQAKA